MVETEYSIRVTTDKLKIYCVDLKVDEKIINEIVEYYLKTRIGLVDTNFNSMYDIVLSSVCLISIVSKHELQILPADVIRLYQDNGHNISLKLMKRIGKQNNIPWRIYESPTTRKLVISKSVEVKPAEDYLAEYIRKLRKGYVVRNRIKQSNVNSDLFWKIIYKLTPKYLSFWNKKNRQRIKPSKLAAIAIFVANKITCDSEKIQIILSRKTILQYTGIELKNLPSRVIKLQDEILEDHGMDLLT